MQLIYDSGYTYSVTGSATQQLVLLQGWATRLSLYDELVEFLSQKYQVTCLGLPGFGSVNEPPEPWGVEEYADYVSGFLEARGIKQATLLGHSYGGRVAIALAARESLPFEVERLVLVDAAGIRLDKSAAQRRKESRFKALRRLTEIPLVYQSFPDLIDDWRSRQGSSDYRNASPLMKKVLVKAISYDQRSQLSDLGIDATLIWGESDTAVPRALAEEMDRLIGEPASLDIVPDAGHFPFIENPVVFYEVLGTRLGINEGEGGAQ